MNDYEDHDSFDNNKIQIKNIKKKLTNFSHSIIVEESQYYDVPPLSNIKSKDQ